MDGLLLVDKPAGLTSHDAVEALRRTLRTRRVGHAGTLDPAATGLLVVLVERATRVAEYLQEEEKEYRVTVRLGLRTPTDDLTSAPLESRPVPSLSREALEPVLARFRGSVLQRPPDYAAVKVGGRKLYEYARAGKPTAVAPRAVTLHALDLLALRPPDLDLRVACSAGTYVRAIARDLGEALGCGGAVAVLRRTRAGAFRVEDAAPLESFRGRRLEEVLVPLDRALGHLPRITLRPEAAEKIRHGQVVGPEDFEAPAPHGLVDSAPCRLCVAGDLLAVGHVTPGSPSSAAGPLVRPRKVFAGR